ncbi:hypothetical protein EV426DRAFT_593798 [Tirmania nivea]|nr:hypothetical protein EV426DRAFT_593798 [Tirmania nivea]
MWISLAGWVFLVGSTHMCSLTCFRSRLAILFPMEARVCFGRSVYLFSFCHLQMQINLTGVQKIRELNSIL